MTINPDPSHRIMTPAGRRGSVQFGGMLKHPWFATYGHAHDMLVIERVPAIARELTEIVRSMDDGATPMEDMCEGGLMEFIRRYPVYERWIRDVYMVEYSREDRRGG